MNLNRWTQWILLSCSLVIVTACSHSKPDPAAIEAANSAYSRPVHVHAHTHDTANPIPDAHAYGLGRESEFGDKDKSERNDKVEKNDKVDKERLVSKRIYYFDYDSNVVHGEDKPAIIANAYYLTAHPKAKVKLEGHTDPRGSREYNIGLGERRAKAVAGILRTQGVSPAQIEVVSYGAEKLASQGHSEADYQQDRRVVLIFVKR